MRRFIVTAAAALALSATSARADWAYTHWGMTPEQVAQASGGAVRVLPSAESKRLTEANLQPGAEGSYTDGAVKLHVAFGFDAKVGGLACVIYTVLDKAQSGELKTVMVKHYGPPQKTSGLPAIGLSMLTWTQPDDINLTLTTDAPAFVFHCANRPQ